MIGSEEALLITKWIVRAMESTKDYETERVRFSCCYSLNGVLPKVRVRGLFSCTVCTLLLFASFAWFFAVRGKTLN